MAEGEWVMGGGGRNAEKTFAGTLKMLEVHRTPFSVVVTLLCF